MWEGLIRTPRGRYHPRKFIMLFATLLVASFAYSLVSSTEVLAADANWNGDNLSYDARDYTGPKTAGNNDKSGLPQGTIYYATYDNSNPRNGTDARGYLIYFNSGTDPTTATRGHHVTADYDVASGRFSNLSPPEEISIDASSYGNEETIEPSSCDVSGIGWIICPVSNWIAEGMDYLYGTIVSFLNVAPIVGGDSGLYQMWDIVRSIANICFIIGFLILIYAQITGAVISSYTIKKMLPRIIIAAILVNVSYWICAIAVDVSNILGVAVQDMFMAMQERIGAANSAADDIGWVKVTALALGGGSLAAIGLFGATAGGAGALAFAIIAALIPALFAVFVAVAILAARQALITVLVVLSPLAFVAYLLPNTEEWFRRWRKLFVALMVMFPAFAVIFGGAQLTGVLIIQNAASLPVVILGLLVQVIPLFITPFLIKLSSGVMSTIAGLANDRSKGVFDRAQNWAKSNQDYHKARAINRGLRPRSRTGGIRPLTSVGARVALSGKNREKRTQALMSGGEGLYSSRTGAGRRTAHLQSVNKQYESYADHRNEERFQDYLAGNDLDTGMGRFAPVRNRRQNQAAALRHIAHESHRAHSDAEALKGLLDAEGEAHYQARLEGATIGDGTRAGQIREARVNTINLSGQADISKAVIEKQGQELLKRTVANDNNLTRQVVLAHQFEKTAEQYETIVQKAAEAAYDNFSRTNVAAQNLRLRAVEQADRAKLAEQQWDAVVEEVSAKGYTTPSIDGANAVVADNISYTRRQIAAEGKRIESAKVVQSENLAMAFKEDEALRTYVGGVDGQRGATRVFAQATDEVVAAAVKEVKTNRVLTSQMSRSQLHKLMQDAEMPDGSHATVEMQQAAMYALLQEKGNNQDANEIRDAVAKMGMMMDDDGNYYEALRDDDGRLILNENGWPQRDESRQITDQKEISRRRDWQQFFDDAAKDSPHSMVTYSGTNKSDARAGLMVEGMHEGFLRDATSGKFSPDKMLKADIDELKTLLEDRNSPTGYYAHLDPDKKRQVDATLESAILRLQSNENINSSIDDRNRGAMNDILSLINPAEYGPRIVDGKRVYTVDENKAIIPRSRATGDEREFRAPVDVPGVHRPGEYYTKWDVDPQV